MLKQEDNCINIDEKCFNPFSFEVIDDLKIKQTIIDDSRKVPDEKRNGILPDFLNINRNYQKLNETYQSIKKMANSYIEQTDNKTQTVSKLESKLNRYIS